MDSSTADPTRHRGPDRIRSALRWIWGVGRRRPGSSPRCRSAPGALVTLSPKVFEEMGAKEGPSVAVNPSTTLRSSCSRRQTAPAGFRVRSHQFEPQQQVDVQLVLVVNGAHPLQIEPSDRLIVLPERGGSPAVATSALPRLTRGLLFLDDDAGPPRLRPLGYGRRSVQSQSSTRCW